MAILTLPTHQHFHLEQLNADDQLLQALESITAEVLGRTVKLQFRSDDDTAALAADDGEDGEDGEAAEREPTRAPEPDQLDEGSNREKPEDLIVDMLGGTVVEE